MHEPNNDAAYSAKESAPETSAARLEPEAQRTTAARIERTIRCATCGHRITDAEERISVGDSHEHRFFNPHGFLFHIGCFLNAGGCTAQGDPTTEFTWFPGFAWRQALCRACGHHLGWRFENDSGYCFFGLILNRLIADDIP